MLFQEQDSGSINVPEIFANSTIHVNPFLPFIYRHDLFGPTTAMITIHGLLQKEKAAVCILVISLFVLIL